MGFEFLLLESKAVSAIKALMVVGTNKIISREMFFVIEIIAVSGLFSMGKHAIVQEINVSRRGIGAIFRKEHKACMVALRKYGREEVNRCLTH